MHNLDRLFPPRIRGAGHATPQVSFRITCHKCPKAWTISGPRCLPDDQVAKKFKERGWLVSKKGKHLCPACINAKPENALASRFRVTANGEAVPSLAELAEQAEAKRQVLDPRTTAALERLIPSKPRAADPPPQAELAAPPTEYDLRSLTTHDIGEMRAALELIAEQNGKRTALIAEQNRILSEQNAMMERHLSMMESHLGHLNQQNDLQVQLIRAVAQIAPTISRSAEGLSIGLRDALATVSEVTAMLERDEDKAALQAPQEPGNGRVLHKAMIKIASYPQKGWVQTDISIDRDLWDRAGFSKEDRFAISGDGTAVRIRRDPDGVKIKRVGPSRVTFQSSRLGNLNLIRYHAEVGDGELLL